MRTDNTDTRVERVWKPSEVSRHLGIQLDSTYKLIHNGDLRAIRVGRNWRVTDSALAEFLTTGSNR